MKYIKKLLALLLIFTLFWWNFIASTYAGSEVCAIKNWTPQLQKYLKELREQMTFTIQEIIRKPKFNPEVAKKQKEEIEKMEKTPWLDNFVFNSISPVTDEVNTIKDKTKNYFSWEWKKVMSLWKQIFRVAPSWDGYILSFWFWLWAVKYDYSLPIAIKRDFDLIRNETERLKEYTDNLIESWIDVNPEFENSYTLWLPWLIELNTRLEYAFMGAVMKWFTNNETAIREANSSITKLNQYIAKYNLNFDTSFLNTYTQIIKDEQCRIWTNTIDQIIDLRENWFEWIFDEWEEAFDLALWLTSKGDDRQKALAEKRSRELFAEFYWTDESEDSNTNIFFENLSNPTSFKRLNPISNTSKQEFENFKKYLKKLDESVENLWDNFNKPGVEYNVDKNNETNNSSNNNDEDSINFKDFHTKSTAEFNKIWTTIDVRNIYEELKYITSSTSKQQNDLKIKILRNHKEIEDALEYINRTIPKAEKVCKSQWVWLWNCDANSYMK